VDVKAAGAPVVVVVVMVAAAAATTNLGHQQKNLALGPCHMHFQCHMHIPVVTDEAEC
jgi:hypothetical protein